jgi:hypothetical protein
LLEGQEDGEVEALLEDAKDWLNQWFKEIRPWNPKDVDTERIVWLRIFGIPAHAWNDDFFIQVSKPCGTFMNSDEGTTKKLTMDVARILIRTSCQKSVDEFFDVKLTENDFTYVSWRTRVGLCVLCYLTLKSTTEEPLTVIIQRLTRMKMMNAGC